MRKFLGAAFLVVFAAVLSMSLAGTAEAKGLRAGSAETTSLPYVEDVSPWSPGKHVASIAVCGKDKVVKSASVKVIDVKTGKRARVDRLGVHVWNVVLKDGRVYRITVKPRNGKAKSIVYGVC